MSRPLSIHCRVSPRFLLLFLFAWLLALPALAAGLKPDKAEIALGEETVVVLSGKPMIAIVTDWSAGNGLELMDSDSERARVKGTKPGEFPVKVKMNGKTYKTSIRVTGKPDDKDGDILVKLEGFVRGLGLPGDAAKQARIARLLYEVTNEIRGADSFYKELAAMGGRMTDVIALRSRLVDMPDSALARQITGPAYPEGGTLVEQRILTWRKQQTLAAINDVIGRFSGRVPADGVKLIVSHVGKWATQDSRSLQFPGDIDFSFVSNDIGLAQEMRAAFLEIIRERTHMDQIALDSVCTAHGKAGLEVYIGRHGMQFAEEMMKINQIVDLEKNTVRQAGIEEVTDILTRERAMLDSRGVEAVKPVQDTEPGLSMEMVRHFDHDIAKSGIFDVTNAVVKAAKYLDRSYKSLEKTGGKPADPKLAEFAGQITAWANAKPQTAQIREDMIRLISEHLGSPPRTVWDAGQRKLVLDLDAAAIKGFHAAATQAMWKTVEQGSKSRTAEMDGRLRDLLERQRKGDDVDEDVARLREDMKNLVDMVEAEIKAIHGGMDIPVAVLTNNARVRAMLDTLSQRFGAKTLSAEELKDKQFVEELLKAQAAHPTANRAEMLKAYIMDRAARSAELSMKGVEKTNQFLDIIDDGLLGALRGDADFADFEAEMKGVRQATADPKGKQEATSRLALLKGRVANGIKTANQKFNGAIQATAAGRQGMKFMAAYGLVDEMRAYRDSFSEQGWGGLATEFFRRRVPLGSAVENTIMGNTYRAGWDVITTLVPPLGLPEAAWGLGTSIGASARSTYWSEQLSLFVDTLYAGAKFELQAVETHGNAKIGVYRLLSVSHPRYGKAIDLSAFAKKRQEQVKELNDQLKTPRYKGGGLDWAEYRQTFQGLTAWSDVDTTLKNNLADSDPVLALLEEMANHPSVGPRLMDRLAEQGLVRWEEVKLGFITNLIIRLEERRQADQALGAGQLPDLFAELRRTAAELEIEEAMLRGLDAEVDTSNMKALVNWLWDTKRSVLGQAPKESETLRAAQVVKKYLDSYAAILKTRNALAGSLPAAAARDGATRYLTGELFLSGRAEADVQAAQAWSKHAAAARSASSEAMLAIKKTFLPRASLDGEDERFLERVFPRELWIKPWGEAGKRTGKTWQVDRAIAQGKERNAILDEYKAWLEKQAPVELTVTLLDALDAKRQIGGAGGDLRPTDELGKPGVGKASGNQLVFGVPTGRYRLTVKAAGYQEAGQDLVLGRGLNPAPRLTLSLTPSDAKGDGKLDEFIASALKARDWKRLADRLDAERKSPARQQNPDAWQAGVDALGKALDSLKDERMQWALKAEAYLYDLDNVDSSVWDKLTRQVEKKREAVEERCYQNTSSSEAYEKRKTRCQNEGRQYESNCLGTWPDQHWQERTAIRVAKQEVPEQVHTLHSAGYFSHRAWFEAVEKMTEKYKLPFPFPKPVVPRLKYAGISCASVDLPGAKPADTPSQLKVSIAAPQASLPFGKPVSLNAAASGGKAPYTYAWSTGARGDRASVTPGWAGEWTVTVSATDAEGKTGEGRATLRVSPQQVKLSGIQPQVFYGSQATLSLPGKEPPPPAADPCAGRSYTGRNPFDECLRIDVNDLKRVSSAPTGGVAPPILPSDMNQVQAPPDDSPAGGGKQRVIWQAEPALVFSPPSSDDGRTRVTYSRMGPVKLWCEIQEMLEGAFHTVGECDQETVNVIAPAFNVTFNPPEGQGRVGQEVRLRIGSEPAVADELIDFRWFDPPTANRLELASNAREIGFKVKDARPVVFKVLARVPHHGDSIAEVAATYTGMQFQVKAWAEEPGTRPMMWDPVKGGLKPVPRGQYATHERIPLRAELQGAPPPAGVRWNWTVNDGTTLSNPLSQTPTVSRSSAGSVEAGVEARDAEGALLGSGSVTLSVMEVRDTPPAPVNPTVSLTADRNGAEQGQNVSISASASGGKPPYRYAWQGASGQGAQASLAATRTGNQSVSVTVTDSNGKTASARIDILVSPSARDVDREKAGKLAAQATRQAGAGDFEGAADSLDNAARHDAETARPAAVQVRDQAKKAAAEAEQRRDFQTSGRLYDAARRIDRNDQEAHIGANNAVAYQRNQEAMLARQRELAGHMERGDWHLAETSQAELKLIDESLPGGLTAETRSLLKRFADGQAAYARTVDGKRKAIAADLQAGRYDNARAGLSALRQIHLIPADLDWAQGMARAIDQAEAESRARSGPGRSASGASGDISGKWRSSEGEVTLTQSGRNVQGRYPNDDGEIVGEMKGNVLEGYWIENNAGERCATAKNGRFYWGRIRWTFEAGKFTGNWSYCDKPVSGGGGWNGERIGTAPFAPLPPTGAVGTTPGASSAASTAGLIATYALDGDAQDGSGNRRHGTVQGARPTADRFGRAGGAMAFDGKSFIELPLDINPGVYPRLSFTAWVRADDASPVRQVMSHDNGGYDRSLGIDTRGGGHGWSAFAGSGGVLGHRPVEIGRWTFVAGVWDQVGRKVRLVVDDTLMEKDGEAGGSDRKLSLGRNPAYGEHFIGALDDVRIYDRLLDMSEIRAIRGGKAQAASLSSSSPRIAGFDWLGMDEDRVGDWGNGRPNGTRDGHFRLTLEGPGRFVINSLSVWSANEKGEKSGGQIWHTRNGDNWMLGVFRDGRQLNASHVASLGEFSGRTTLDLYANSSGWFNPGQVFLVEMESADGRLVQRTLRLGEVSSGAAPGSPLKLAEQIPSTDSARFRGNLRTDLSMHTSAWDRTPYLMAPPREFALNLKRLERACLAGDAKGSAGWRVDNFLLFELYDPAGRLIGDGVVGGHEGVSRGGRRIPEWGNGHEQGPCAVNLKPHLPLGQPFRLKVSAMDYGGVGYVSDVWLLLDGEVSGTEPAGRDYTFPEGGRDYTYRDLAAGSSTPLSTPPTTTPGNAADSQPSLEEAGKQLKDAVKELKNLFKW